MAKKSTTLVSISTEVFGIGNIINIEHFSDLIKLFRLSAWVLRFVTNLKKKHSGRKFNLNRFITTSEIRFVKLLWIQENQAKLEISDGFNNLKNSLRLQKDSNDIYRSSSHISNAKSLSHDAKNPIILCRNHRMTKLIVWDAHNRIKYLGERQTLVESRSYYWIPRGKSFVKKVLHRCITSKRFNSRPYLYPKSPNLPKVRLNEDNAFSGAGIDYLGPLYCNPVDTRRRFNDYTTTIRCH